jgi:hypothetical protein
MPWDYARYIVKNRWHPVDAHFAAGAMNQSLAFLAILPSDQFTLQECKGAVY